MTFNSLLADIGGALGLWLGLNVCEVLLFLSKSYKYLAKGSTKFTKRAKKILHKTYPACKMFFEATKDASVSCNIDNLPGLTEKDFLLFK